MYSLLGIFLIYLHFGCATNCYELQQAQISSLNDRMFQMLNSFYSPLPQNPVPAIAATPSTDYSNPYVYPYPYPLPPTGTYGPSPAFYTTPPAPPVPPVPYVQGTPGPKPLTYYNPTEYNAVSNWGSNYYSYPQYYEHAPPSPYEPPVPPYQIPPPPYPPPSQCITLCPSSSLSSPSPPPPPFFQSWEYAPYSPEYATSNYAPLPPILPYAVPPLPSPLPAHYPYVY